MNKNRHFIWVILLIVISLLLGFYAGKYFRIKNPQIKILRSEQNKINEALEVISNNYVDTVDISYLAESAVGKIISELDPHSSYIPASDVEAANEDLESSFSGIGIQFNMQTDTIIVISIISGGPAEKAGLMPFDRIMTVNDSIVAGQNISTTKMMRMLRGPKNSKVKLGIQRGNAKELTDFELIRGDIPNYSVDVSYKINDNIGYIKVTKFARSTYSEFLTAIAKLKQEGVKGFIIDLRDNPGGYMESAIYMINEFLSKGNMIVYTQGRAYSRTDTYSNGKGTCQDAPLVVLINELSGSASEIFSGAIQDNDRGLIIGRRSYGKGLVQTKLDLSDNSELLLTIARYYTPSGRCIQKDYELGKSEEYSQDIYNRFMHGEFYSVDSIKMNDSLEFKTTGGRPVYG
ncbi:MAG: S41 family peptidase, partial [Tannerella sp.]|nr:S41 family peptidase [Tannerella sp.]